jgi:arylsulfatase A
LFILTDDQGIGDVSLHGNDSIRTPNLDALLQRGVQFDRFYVSPVCAPTRASFLSGQYHPRTGAIQVTRRLETMDDDVVTVAEHLQRAGYRTGLYGKWHNGATFPYHPGAQGFDEFLGFTLGHYNNYFSGVLRDERDRAVTFDGYLTEVLTDSALHFMLEPVDNSPFFCMLTYQAPHTPVQVPDVYYERVKERGLDSFNTGVYAMIEAIDDQLGRIVERLTETGELENTIVVFATDNGPNGQRYRMGLKGVKGHVDEGGVRVPFGILLPGDHPANGTTVSTPAAHIDLLPTLQDLVGLPIDTSLDGVSLRPLLEGDTFAHRYIYAFKHGREYTGYPGSMRDERYLYVANDSSSHELYDLMADPGQRNNIYGQAGPGTAMAATYRNFAPALARPDLIAPPIDLDAAPGAVRLLAHEGHPLGETEFREGHGWANDFFVRVGVQGAYWPVITSNSARHRVGLSYHLTGTDSLAVIVSTDKGTELRVTLPARYTQQLSPPDRYPRIEVYPRDWSALDLGTLAVPAGTQRLTVRTAQSLPVGAAFWVKELTTTASGKLGIK